MRINSSEFKNRVNFCFILFIIFISVNEIFAQGYNHSWLLGRFNQIDTNTTSSKARLNFDSNNVSIVPETRKMAFYETQATISDENNKGAHAPFFNFFEF